jgi:tryptophan synthase alpha chain
VIVGSAFVTRAAQGVAEVEALATELAEGVRSAPTPIG